MPQSRPRPRAARRSSARPRAAPPGTESQVRPAHATHQHTQGGMLTWGLSGHLDDDREARERHPAGGDRRDQLARDAAGGVGRRGVGEQRHIANLVRLAWVGVHCSNTRTTWVAARRAGVGRTLLHAVSAVQSRAVRCCSDTCLVPRPDTCLAAHTAPAAACQRGGEKPAHRSVCWRPPRCRGRRSDTGRSAG